MIKIATITNNPQLINDWVEWHKKFNFDEIIIFNNSDSLFKIDGTTEIDYKNVEAPQLKVYQSFIEQMPLNDWVLFLDDDELLELKDCNDVHEFLEPYKNVDTVRLNWQCYGDCGQIHYSSEPLWERFKEPCDINVIYNDKLKQQGITENMHIKSFYHRTFKPAQANVHTVMVAGSCAVNTRMETQIGDSPFQEICWDKALVRHYITQDTETFAKRRMNKKDCTGNVVATNDELKRFYFNINEYSKEKEEVLNAYASRNPKDIQ